MKAKILFCSLFLVCISNAQTVIPLYQGAAPGSEDWTWDEKEYFIEQFQSKATYDVSKPTLTLYSPKSELANGIAVIVCPGGAFRMLAADKEGHDVAQWLISKGITAFVLKYRLVKSETENPADAMKLLFENQKKFDSINAPVVEMAIADGSNSIKYVREHATQFNIDKNKIGIMGFSAGGTVAAGATFNYNSAANRPDFSVPVYPATHVLTNTAVPTDAPPMFIVVATDDGLLSASESIMLYTKWLEARKDVELHAYSKGEHGFGVRKQGFPVDGWTTRFEEWLSFQGFQK